MGDPTLPNVKRILSAARTYKKMARRRRVLGEKYHAYSDEAKVPLNLRSQYQKAQWDADTSRDRLLFYIVTGEFCPPHLAAKRKAKS